MEENKYTAQNNALNLLDIKIYDELFPRNIRSNAGLLISKNNFESFKQIEKNMYEAIVPGTYDYMVRVLLNDDNSLENCACDCAYYHNTSKYCKHVYALLNKIITEKNNCVIQKKYDENILLFGKELDKLKIIIEKSKNKINNSFTKNWIIAVYERMEEDFKDSNGIKLSGMRQCDSYYILNRSLSLLDEAKIDIKKIEIELKENYNFMLENDSYSNKDEIMISGNKEKVVDLNSQNRENNIQFENNLISASKKKNIIEKFMSFFK